MSNLKLHSLMPAVCICMLLAACNSAETTSENETASPGPAHEAAAPPIVSYDSMQSEFDNIHSCTELYDEFFDPSVYLDLLTNKAYYSLDTLFKTSDTTFSYNIQYAATSKSIIPEAKAAGQAIYFWPKGYKIKVEFLEGDPVVKDKVMKIAKEWEQYANVKLIFGTFSDPDITISFDKKSGSWSWIGIQSKKHRPSMNYGWLTPTTPDNEFRRVVLHEFGHALGMIHEHSNPEGNPIRWNEPLVYAFYRYSQGWSDNDIYHNVIHRYSKNQIKGTKFDSKSIMLYPVDSRLTINGYSTQMNYLVSDSDKAFISSIYPR